MLSQMNFAALDDIAAEDNWHCLLIHEVMMPFANFCLPLQFDLVDSIPNFDGLMFHIQSVCFANLNKVIAYLKKFRSHKKKKTHKSPTLNITYMGRLSNCRTVATAHIRCNFPSNI